MGTRTAQLSITNADVTNNPFILHLTGVGIGAPVLTNSSLSNGSFVFSFTGDSSSQYTILTATNVSVPRSNWTVAGSATNTSSSNFTFGTPVTTGQPQKFFKVRFQ